MHPLDSICIGTNKVVALRILELAISIFSLVYHPIVQ
jgi:hypothetical protein